MRGLRAGLLATVLGVGCKDNPGFELAPDGPASGASTTTGDPGSTLVPGDSSSTGGDVATFDVTFTTDEPPTTAVTTSTTTTDTTDTTTDTTGPTSSCGDGVTDMELGEQCDDGNTVPNDGCTDNCRFQFIPGEPIPNAGTCIGIDAARINGDARLDLLLVRQSTVLPVLEADESGDYVDMGRFFSTLNNQAASALIAKGQPEDQLVGDAVIMQGNVAVCPNNGAVFCAEPTLYEVFPEALQTTVSYLSRQPQIGDIVGNDKFVDVLVAVRREDPEAPYSGDALGVLKGLGTGLLEKPLIVKSFDALKDNGKIKAFTLASIAPPDAALDLVLGYEKDGSGFVIVARNFAGNPEAPIQVGKSVTAITAADLELGGQLGDILVADTANGKLVHIGDSNESAQFKLQPGTIPIASTLAKVVATTLRGEADHDIVAITKPGNELLVASLTEKKLPDAFIGFDTGVANLVDFVVADLDGDGDQDVAVISNQCTVKVLVNQYVVPGDDP